MTESLVTENQNIKFVGEAEAEVNKKSIEIVIPEIVQTALKRGAQEFTETLKENDFDLVLVLRRAGSTVFPAVSDYTKSQGIVLPKVSHIYLGRELVIRFKKYLEENGTGFDETSEFPFKEHLDEFKSWLVNDETSMIKMEKLRKLVASPNKILIVDDTRFGGDTLDHVATALLHLTFGDSVKIQTQTLLEQGDWQEKIISATFGDVGRAGEYFLDEAMSGFLAIPDGLKKIKSATDLETLGKITLEEKGENPYSELEKKYGKEALLKLHTNLILAFKKAVRPQP